MTESRVEAHPDRRRSIDFGLALAGLFTAGMALYHFCLPFIWGWGDALQHEPMLRWALFMLNASFSYLLLAGGTITVALAFGTGARDRAGRWLLMAMCGYWLFNAVYQIAAPMPMPARLASLRWGLFGFAAAVALLYVAALLRRPDAAAPSTARPAGLTR